MANAAEVLSNIEFIRPEETPEAESTDESPDTETETEEEASTEDSEEAEEASPEEETKDEPETNELEEFPEQIRGSVEKFVKKKEDALSLRIKEIEGSLEKSRQDAEGFYRVAQEVLQDPSKLEHYRQVYGYAGKQPKTAETSVELKPDYSKLGENPTIENVMDVMSEHLHKIVEQRIRQVEGSVETKITQTTQQREAVSRWDGALATLRSDPKFSKYEKVVVNMVKSEPKYKPLYTGSNEVDVLKSAFNDFQGLLQEDLDASKKELSAVTKRKKAAASLNPSGKTVVSKQAGKKETDAERVARISAEIGI